MRRLVFFFLVLFVAELAFADVVKTANRCNGHVSHSLWDGLLRRHVTADGLVNYTSMLDEREDLQRYLRDLSAVCKTDYEEWSRDEQLAYWINAYNAFTVELIFSHYPIDSIRSIGWLPLAAFREEFIPIRFVTGESLSLNEVEHEIIRKHFDEPRIHFAVNCASMSCPRLRNEAYVPQRLDAQLEDAAKTFLGDTRHNRHDPESGVLYLSKIFDWYGEDFEEAAGSVVQYVLRYLPKEKAAKVADGVEVDFLDYDWSLNERR